MQLMQKQMRPLLKGIHEITTYCAEGALNGYDEWGISKVSVSEHQCPWQTLSGLWLKFPLLPKSLPLGPSFTTVCKCPLLLPFGAIPGHESKMEAYLHSESGCSASGPDVTRSQVTRCPNPFVTRCLGTSRPTVVLVNPGDNWSALWSFFLFFSPY